jgi:hypothetical protein
VASICDVDPYADPKAVVYLDHDPTRSALYTIDRDVAAGILTAAHHMSAAWASLCPDLYQVDWRWVAAKEPTPPGELEQLRAEVLGQRVLVERMPVTQPQHRAAAWAAELGGNYRWLWQNAMELLGIWRHWSGAPHPMTPTIYTLEVLPPVLLETSCDRTEPPLTMQAEYIVTTPDGNYQEAVDSWRKLYVKRRQHALAWSGRPVPPWLELQPNGRYQLRKP